MAARPVDVCSGRVVAGHVAYALIANFGRGVRLIVRAIVEHSRMGVMSTTVMSAVSIIRMMIGVITYVVGNALPRALSHNGHDGKEHQDDARDEPHY